jgi:hypothetical protein
MPDRRRELADVLFLGAAIVLGAFCLWWLRRRIA